MVQIIPRQQNILEKFLQALGGVTGGLAEGGGALKQAMTNRSERKRLGEMIGQDVSDIRNPSFQEQLLSSHLRGEEQQKKLAGEYAADEESYSKIKDAFGQKFADVWRASPTGARTALTNAALEARARGIDLDKILGGTRQASNGIENETPSQMGIGQTQSSETFNFPQIKAPSDMTPSEEVKYRSELRKQNRDIHKENIDKSRGLKDTGQHLEILEDLNTKIPEGVTRLLIDKEGNIRPSALRFKAIPKEAERFSKTVNDFLTSAKDVFGSRVTNYDIQQFKSRLPGLLNSKEGRTEIIQQMKILNQIERNYRNALTQIYRHYGLEGIPEEQAQALAEQMTESEEEQLRAQLLRIGEPETSEMSDQGQRPSLEEIFG